MANGPFQLGLPNIPGLSSGPVNVGFNANGLAGQVRVPGLGPITFNFPGLTDISQPPTNQNFSINNFMQNLANHNETARSDKFDILLVPPASVAKYFGISPAAAAVGFNLQCEVSMLPGREIQTIEYTTHAFVRRVPQMNRFGKNETTRFGRRDFDHCCTGKWKNMQWIRGY